MQTNRDIVKRNPTNLEDSESLDLTLDETHALNPGLGVAPSARHFGERPEVEKRNVQLRIGKRPLVRSLRDLYEKTGRAIPPDLEVFMSYRIWMITHVVSVVREPGLSSVKHLDYEVSFPDKPCVTVTDLLPQARFVTRLAVEGKADWEFSAGLEANGSISAPPELGALITQSELLSVDGHADAKLTLANTGSLVGKISFRVVTSVISAVGVGDTWSRWMFTKEDLPMIGDYIMVQTVLVPRVIETLSFKARVGATMTTFGIPDKRRSTWINMKCSLPRSIK
jgi:hypothetical protein